MKNTWTNAFLKREQGKSIRVGIYKGFIFFKHNVASGVLQKAFTLITNTLVYLFRFSFALCIMESNLLHIFFGGLVLLCIFKWKPTAHFLQWTASVWSFSVFPQNKSPSKFNGETVAARSPLPICFTTSRWFYPTLYMCLLIFKVSAIYGDMFSPRTSITVINPSILSLCIQSGKNVCLTDSNDGRG